MSVKTEHRPIWMIDTTEAVKPPAEGLASISHRMLERVQAMQELEGHPELQGKKVCYAILSDKGNTPVVLEGQAEADFKVSKQPAKRDELMFDGRQCEVWLKPIAVPELYSCCSLSW